VNQRKELISHQLSENVKTMKEYDKWKESTPYAKTKRDQESAYRVAAIAGQVATNALLKEQTKAIKQQKENMDQQSDMMDLQMLSMVAGLWGGGSSASGAGASGGSSYGGALAVFGMSMKSLENQDDYYSKDNRDEDGSKRDAAKKGAATGAAIGSIWGPMGAAVGSAIGGFVGPVLSQWGDDFTDYLDVKSDMFENGDQWYDEYLYQLIHLIQYPADVFEHWGEQLDNLWDTEIDVFGKSMKDMVRNIIWFPIEQLMNLFGYDTDDEDNKWYFSANIFGITSSMGEDNHDNYLEIDFLADLFTYPPTSDWGNTRIRSEGFAGGGFLNGPSHDQGGINALVGNQIPIELEGGEYIIKKSTVDALGTSYFDKVNNMKFEMGGATIEDNTHELFDIDMTTSGMVEEILGKHGFQAYARIKGVEPEGDIKIFSEGGDVAKSDREEWIHLANKHKYLGEAWVIGGIERDAMDVEPFLNMGYKPPGWLFGGNGGYIPSNLSNGGHVSGTLSSGHVPGYLSGGRVKLASGGAISNDALFGIADPEVKHLLAELISTVREKKMAVNVFTDTGEQVDSRIELFKDEMQERNDRDLEVV
jgi:hypothetical protein